MNIEKLFKNIEPTQDQANALKDMISFLEVSQDQAFVLKGYAGSGKTTLLRTLLDYLDSRNQYYRLMAPTGRAAKVIHQKTGRWAGTIHKTIYAFDNLKEIESKDKEDINIKYFFSLKKRFDDDAKIYIVDEASMISNIYSEGELFRFGSGYLLDDLLEFARIGLETRDKIIFIGDNAQLPPVGMSYSPALSVDILREKYRIDCMEAVLKEVKRQEGESAILKIAKSLRYGITSGYYNDFDLRENGEDMLDVDFSDFMSSYQAEEQNKIIITYKNKTAYSLNRDIRLEKYGRVLPIQDKDVVIIGANNYGKDLMNGEFALVKRADPRVVSREVVFNREGKTHRVLLTWRKVELIVRDNRQTNGIRGESGYILENYLNGESSLDLLERIALYVDFKNRNSKLKPTSTVFREALLKDDYYNCILVKYGYAITCHKAQGGEWPSSFIFWDKGVGQGSSSRTNSDFYRWAYTAITRASTKLYSVNAPYFNPFSNLSMTAFTSENVVGIRKIKKGNTVLLDDYYREQLYKIILDEIPDSIRQHFLERVYWLRTENIELEFWEKFNYEVRYTFKRAGERASVKYWINGKNCFNENYQQLSSMTTSTDLYEEVTSIFSEGERVIFVEDIKEAPIMHVGLEEGIEEAKPFLALLYKCLITHLAQDIKIEKIEHLDYRERYTFVQGEARAVLDFEYDKKGFFGRVLPLFKQCRGKDLLEHINLLLEELKNS